MTLNQIKQAAEIAKSRTSDKRWIAAIDKAVAGVESGWWIVTELATCLAITTETGKTYFANGICQCRAYENSTACKHRALYRLYAIANETLAAEEAARRCDRIVADIKEIAHDIAASPRKNLIIEIENIWSRTQTTPLAVELMARFRVNKLEFLSDDMLRAVRMAIAL